MIRRRLVSSRGISLIEVLVAVAVSVLLAAVIAPAALTWIDGGRSARAQSDAAIVATAMTRFFQDTTKWPGQVEILESGSDIRFLTVGAPTAANFPDLAGSNSIGPATCAGGLSGVTSSTAFVAAVPSVANSIDITDFLSSPPPAADYPNWKGPYLTVDITSDPWERVFVVNVIPLFCDETVTASTPGGALGFGWVMSGGPNGTLQTPFTVSRLGADADDLGVVLGKRAVQAP